MKSRPESHTSKNASRPIVGVGRKSWARRKSALTIASTVGVIALLAGCSSAGGGGSSGMTGKTVKIFTWVGSPADKTQFESYIKGGKVANPDLDISFGGPAIGSYYTKLPTQLKGSDAPCLITLQNGTVEKYASALEPIAPYMKKAGIKASSYDSSMMKQLSANGTMYGLPYDAEPLVVYYNKKLFAAAGLKDPALNWTTADFLKDAKALTTGNTYGFAVGQGIGQVGNFLAANNEDYVSKSGVANLTSSALQKRTQWYFDLATKYKVAQPLEASGGSFPDIDKFKSGQAAMFVNGTWDRAEQNQALGAENVGIAVIPSDNGMPHGSIAGSGFAMTKSCGDKTAAFKAMSSITSAASQQHYAKTFGLLGARPDALSAWGVSAGAQEAAVVNVLSKNGRIGVAATNGDQLNTLFTQYEVDGFSGKSSAVDVLKNVQAGLGQ